MNYFKSAIITVILISLLNERAHAAPAWATEVHNLLITTAFPEESWQCWVAMQNGSADADSFQYQQRGFAYMHAMREKGQDASEASKLMWAFVDQKFAEVRVLDADQRNEDSCYTRGMALHPVMDSTSPAHKEFAEWDPIEFQDLFQKWVIPEKLMDLVKHGDVDHWIKTHLHLSLPFNLSEENIQVIKDRPELEELTVNMMKLIDQVERQSL